MESRHLIGLSERRTLNEASDQSHPISEPLVGLAIQRDVVVISEGARIVDNYGLAVGRDLGGVPPKTETKSRL